MATQGTAIVNFGSGALEARVVVTGQSGITSANLLEAWPACTETVGDENDDSAWVEQLQAFATYIVNATGFTIIVKAALGKAHGAYSINWCWN